MKKAFVAVISLIIAISTLTLAASAVTPTYTMSKPYKQSKYYDNFKTVDLTGDQVADVLAIALSQLGYHEGDSDADMGGLNDSGVKDFVEYNVLYGKVDNQQGNGVSHGYSWCASFVNWCLRQARVSTEASAASEISCRRWLAKCKGAGIYREKKGYIPQAGDLIFFKDEGSEVTATHIGIVLSSDGKRVYTVEGNTSDGSEFSRDGNYVACKKYSLNSDYIVGYASPTYERNADVPYVDCLGRSFGEGTLIATETISAYQSKDMSGEATQIENFTVFTVEGIYGEVAKIKYKVNGISKTLWANIKGKAIQLEAEKSDISVSYMNSDGELLITQYGNAGGEISVAGALGYESHGGFVGWRLDMGEIDIIFRPGDEFKLGNEDLILHAIWDHEIYEVVFKDANGNIISTDSGYFGDDVDEPVLSAPEGYYFAGWLEGEVTDDICGNAVYTAVMLELGSESSSADEGTGQTDADAQTEPEANSSGCRAGVMFGELLIALVIALSAISFKKKRSDATN